MSGLLREVGRRLLRPWLLHAAGLAAIAIVGFNALRIPIGAPTPEQRPGWPAGGESAAALVVDRARLAREAKAPPPFSRRDWSLAWLNTLGQEIGPAALLEVAALDSAGHEPARLERFGLIVLSRGASARLETAPAATLAALARWVEAGGALVAELPGPALAELTGLAFTPPAGTEPPAGATAGAAKAAARPDEGLPPARLWRDLRGAPDFLPTRPGLARLPLHTRLRAPSATAAGVETLATLEGQPFVCARPRGAGLVLSVCADFGLFLTATQQGLPQEDYTVVNRYPEILPNELKTADLMPDLAYHDNDVPIADLLERAIVQYARAGAGVPVPALWYWPDGALGVYLMTHDDEARGARAEWMPADETARGVPSTCYYIATWGLDGASLGRVAAGGHTVGLHWVRGTADYAMRETWPLPKLGPFLREVTLPGQTARLRRALAAVTPGGAGAGHGADSGAAAVRHCRLHYLLWDGRWARTFAQLAAAGYELDSSYGPDFHCKGYLFGTAYPFHPLDGNGRPYALFELPYQHSELEAGANGAWLDSLAAASRAGDHAAIVSLFHPPFMAFAPSAEAYRLWRELPERMAAAGHPAVTMERVLQFAREREGTILVLERLPPAQSATEGIPAILPASLTGSAIASATTLPIVERWRVTWEIPAGADGHWLTVPATLRGRLVNVVQPPAEATASANAVSALMPGPTSGSKPGAGLGSTTLKQNPTQPVSLPSLGGAAWWGSPLSGRGSIVVELNRCPLPGTASGIHAQ